MTDLPPIREAKRELRERMVGLRLGGNDDAALSEALFRSVETRPPGVVAGVWPLPGEPDLRALWERLHRRGDRIVLPETPPRGEALRFRPWVPGCEMHAGRFGTVHPASEPLVAPVLDVVFVPLLAFDRSGFRLGYGGGYYDRTLARLPGVHSIGFGFSFQEVDAVPRGPFDLPLSAIVTETGCVTIER